MKNQEINCALVQDYVNKLIAICESFDIWLDSDVYEDVAALPVENLKHLEKLDKLSTYLNYELKQAEINEYDITAIEMLAALSGIKKSELKPLYKLS